MNEPDECMKLAENNINLAYKLAWEYFIKLKSTIELDELKSICLYGLTKAAKTFDATKNFEFSTYAYTVMRNAIIKHVRYNIKHNHISISEQLTDDLTLEDTLQADINVEDEVAYKLKIEKLYSYINNLNEQDKTIVLSYLKGLNTQSIADILHISKQQVNAKYRKAINKLRYAYLKGGDFEWDI